jgi:hypothetical protein
MQLSPYRTGLARRHLQRLPLPPASPTCSCPSGFRFQVNRMAQKYSSELLLTMSGMQHRVPRRTVYSHPAFQSLNPQDAGGVAVPHECRHDRGDTPPVSSVGGRPSPGPTVAAGVGRGGVNPAGVGGDEPRSGRVSRRARTSPPAGAEGVQNDCSSLPSGGPRGWHACAVAAKCRPRWLPVASSLHPVPPRLAGPDVGREPSATGSGSVAAV